MPQGMRPQAAHFDTPHDALFGLYQAKPNLLRQLRRDNPELLDRLCQHPDLALDFLKQFGAPAMDILADYTSDNPTKLAALSEQLGPSETCEGLYLRQLAGQALPQEQQQTLLNFLRSIYLELIKTHEFSVLGPQAHAVVAQAIALDSGKSFTGDVVASLNAGEINGERASVLLEPLTIDLNSQVQEAANAALSLVRVSQANFAPDQRVAQMGTLADKLIGDFEKYLSQRDTKSFFFALGFRNKALSEKKNDIMRNILNEIKTLRQRPSLEQCELVVELLIKAIDENNQAYSDYGRPIDRKGTLGGTLREALNEATVVWEGLRGIDNSHSPITPSY